MKYIKRNLTDELEKTIQTRPLTYLNGARQVGKSTLCAHLSETITANHLTFDSPLLLSSAKADPATFVDNLPENVLNIIDEVQFAPEIFPYLKMKIDQDRLKGKKSCLYLLTGSANLLALPALSEAFVGRMSVLTLYPFTANEYYQKNLHLTARLFNEEIKIKSYPEYDIIEAITHATYPEIAASPEIERIRWFDDYVTTILNRDVKSLSDIRNPEKMVILLSFLTMRIGGLLNNTGIASEIGIDYRTYEKFLAFALNTFLVFTLQSWSTPNKLNKRFTKAPKLYFTDCNLLSYFIKRPIAELYTADKITFGHLFENFVAAELQKHAKLTHEDLFYFRTTAGKEVDFVLENETGDIIGMEVKSAKNVVTKDIAGLIELKHIAGEKFKRGFVIYLGNDVVPLGDQIWAIPACMLWS